MFNPGDKVIILKSDCFYFVGKNGVVIENDKVKGTKIKLSFCNSCWYEYYPESHLMKFEKNNDSTLYVNLFGAPCAGKSTGATYVFSQLKLNGVDAEYVGEFAKDKCWENNKFIFESPENQFYIGAKQFYRINKMYGKVKVVITDSPIFLNSFYNKSKCLGKEYNIVMLRLFNKFRNLNFYIERVRPYNSNGRIESEEQANEIGKEIKRYIDKNHISYISVSGNEIGYKKIFETVMNFIKEENDSNG